MNPTIKKSLLIANISLVLVALNFFILFLPIINKSGSLTILGKVHSYYVIFGWILGAIGIAIAMICKRKQKNVKASADEAIQRNILYLAAHFLLFLLSILFIGGSGV